MARCYRLIGIATLAAVTLGGTGTALAQAARSGGGANVQLLQQMQQLASERTALQAENERLKGELADARKERDALKGGLDRRARESAAALAQSNAERESSAQELAQSKARMQELIAKFRETIDKLREAETAGATAKRTLETRDRELKTCVDHNVALFHLNDEVLTHFDHQGLWSRLSRAEAFTQIQRVRNENLIDDYRSRAQDQVTPGAKPGANGSGPAPATSPPTPASPDGTGSR